MSGGSASSESASQNWTKDLTPDEYKALRPWIGDVLRGFGETGGPGYEGAFAAQMTAGESAALDQMGMFSDPSANAAAGDRLLGDTISGQYLTPESSPFLKDYIAAASRPINQAFDEGDLETRALFARAGHRLPESSPFARAQAISNRGRADALRDVGTQIGFAAYDRERGAQERAVAAANEIDRSRFEQAKSTLEAKALPRLIEQYGLDQGYAEFNRRMSVMMSILGLGAGLSSPVGQFGSFGWSKSSSESSQGGV